MTVRETMSETGYDAAILKLLQQNDVHNPSLLAEEIIEAIEADDYRIVHKSQVRSRDELLRAILAESG